MGARRRAHLLFLFLALAFSAFLTVHALLVQIDFEACFENLGRPLVDGQRPYRRVAEMSLGQLAHAAGGAMSADYLILSIPALLPFTPFWVAWAVSRSRAMQTVWIVAAIVAFVVIAGWVFTTGLAGFYECDRNGVSVGIVVLPILYTAATLAATLVLAGLRFVFLSATGRE